MEKEEGNVKLVTIEIKTYSNSMYLLESLLLVLFKHQFLLVIMVKML